MILYSFSPLLYIREHRSKHRPKWKSFSKLAPCGLISFRHQQSSLVTLIWHGVHVLNMFSLLYPFCMQCWDIKSAHFYIASVLPSSKMQLLIPHFSNDHSAFSCPAPRSSTSCSINVTMKLLLEPIFSLIFQYLT